MGREERTPPGEPERMNEPIEGPLISPSLHRDKTGKAGTNTALRKLLH